MFGPFGDMAPQLQRPTKPHKKVFVNSLMSLTTVHWKQMVRMQRPAPRWAAQQSHKLMCQVIAATVQGGYAPERSVATGQNAQSNARANNTLSQNSYDPDHFGQKFPKFGQRWHQDSLSCNSGAFRSVCPEANAANNDIRIITEHLQRIFWAMSEQLRSVCPRIPCSSSIRDAAPKKAERR